MDIPEMFWSIIENSQRCKIAFWIRLTEKWRYTAFTDYYTMDI